MLAFFQTPLRVKMYVGDRYYHKLVNQDFLFILTVTFVLYEYPF